ncbi:MAG: MerR family transcriptional regulator, partial [Burkholderiaceae bacterium]
MKRSKSSTETTVDASPDLGDTARYRTGAVARMVRMPAATLRVWERRYAVARPQTTAAGHRLYS